MKKKIMSVVAEAAISVTRKMALVVALGFAGVVAAQEEVPPVELPEAPLPEHIHGDILYGDPNAPVEIVAYASMTCPHCKHFHEEVVHELEKELIPAGKVKLLFRNFVRDRADVAISVLSRCTGDVEQAKRLINVYFERQPEWMQSEQIGLAIQSIANTNGISFDRIRECTTNRELVEHLVEMRRVGMNAYEVTGTPTVIMNGTKAQYKSFDELLSKIQMATVSR